MLYFHCIIKKYEKIMNLISTCVTVSLWYNFRTVLDIGIKIYRYEQTAKFYLQENVAENNISFSSR